MNFLLRHICSVATTALLFGIAWLLTQADCHADIITGETTITYSSGGTPVDLFVKIDDDTNLVDITMTGRSDGWFSMGFGNSVMLNTYGITIHQDGTFDERKLNYGGGSLLTSSLTELSNTVSGGLRTVELQRAIDVGDSDYFTFPTAEDTVPLISASNAGAYVYHGAINRSTGSIQLVAVPEPTAVAFLWALGSGLALRRKRRS